MKPLKVFVLGSHGLVGRALMVSYLPAMQTAYNIEVVTLPQDAAHDAVLQFDTMRDADIVVLCLPDDAAREAAKWAQEANPKVRILDASAAHRCEPLWVYGLPDVIAHNEYRAYELISRATYVANPGCFATGCVMLAHVLEPLLRGLNATYGAARRFPRMAFQGITGYSAGGHKAQVSDAMPYLAQFGSEHRHLPEIEMYGKVDPVLTTTVGDWYQGMQVQTTVDLEFDPVLAQLQEVYGANPRVEIRVARQGERRVSAVECNDTDKVILTVAKQPRWGVTVAATYDNLGKGSAGALASNLRWMIEGYRPRD